ncbi:MAG: hypothetical protein ACPL1F_06355, partial [bacterium]
LALNKLTVDEVVNILKDILLKEDLNEFEVITLSRKFKELNKLDQLVNTIMQVINNDNYNSNKRFYLIKIAFDIFDEDLKKELINKITNSENPIDFLNLVSVIKDNTNYKELIKSVLKEKIEVQKDFFNKIIYYNIFANLYGLNELFNLIITEYNRNYKIDYLILLYVLLFYFRDKNLLSTLEDFIENNFKDSFIYILFYNLKNVLFKDKVLIYFLDFEELYNQSRNLFLAFIGFIFTKKLVEDFNIYINSFRDYRAVIFKRLVNFFIKEDMVDVINQFDISNGENEYFIEEQAIIELNDANFRNLLESESGLAFGYKEDLFHKSYESISIKTEEIKDHQENNIEVKTEKLETEEIKNKELKTEEFKIEEIKNKETEIEEIKTGEMEIKEIKHKEIVEEVRDEEVKSEEIKTKEIKIEEIEDKELKTEEFKIDEEDIISQVEKDIEKIVHKEVKLNQEIKSISTEDVGKLEVQEKNNIEESIQEANYQKQEKQDLNQNIDNFIKNFSNINKDELENFKELIQNDSNFKDNFFVKLEDYVFNEENLKNEINNIILLLNFVKNNDNLVFNKLIKAIIPVLLGYDNFSLFKILSSTIGINKITLKDYFVDNDLLDFNLNISDFIDFVDFIVNNRLESVEEIIRLLAYLTELKELTNDSKDKINSLITKLIELI